MQNPVNRTWRKSGAGLRLLTSSPLIVRKRGELRATEHTMMPREVAFINTQGSGLGPANNRGNDDGGQWVWGVGKARMIPSMTIAEQAVGGGGGGGGAEGGLGIVNQTIQIARQLNSHNTGQWIL